MASTVLPPAGSLAAVAASAGRRRRIASLEVRASQGMAGRDGKAFSELGLYSLKKRIEDAVVRVEMTASNALDMEEARKVKHEKMLHEYNLWDDPSQSYGKLAALADSIKVVDGLKDLRYKAEEAKLITQLAEMDIIGKELVKQAYAASQNASEFLDHYELSKLLTSPFDKAGACVIVEAGSNCIASELWAEKIFSMYTSWAEKHGYRARVTELCKPNGSGISLATVEYESEYMYGYLSGEIGTHRMISDLNDGDAYQALSATVDVIPLFLDAPPDIQIDATDMEVSSTSDGAEAGLERDHVASIRHIPSGITVRSSGERSRFANEFKALNRLKAKIMVLIAESITDPGNLKKRALEAKLTEARHYMFGQRSLVHDLKTAVAVHDPSYILGGNIEQLIRAHVSLRHHQS